MTPRLRAPSPHQRAALQAALLRGDAAIAAWTELQRFSNYLDVTDGATFRLLPMTYRNLREAGLPESQLTVLKGIYRQAWYRNRVVLAYAQRTIGVLRDAGVEPLALKGLGLIGTAYAGAALRPMEDIDLLVRPALHTAASEALLRAGWRPTRGSVARYYRRVRVFHGMPLIDREGIEVDLHRAMLEENISPHGDDGLFERSVEAAIDGFPVRTLSPEDHVLNACVHGARWDWGLSLRWAVDAATLARGPRPIDWGLVLAEARRRGVTMPLAASLAFVADYCSEIPQETIAAAAAAPAGRLARRSFLAQQSPDSMMNNGVRTVARYLQTVSDQSWAAKVIGFPVYLEWIWGLESPRQVPADGLKRLVRQVRHR